MLNNINPSIKCITIIICGLMLAFTYSIKLNTIVFIFCLICLLCSAIRYYQLFKMLIWIFIAASGLFMVGYYFSADSQQIINHQAEQSLLFSASTQTGLQLATRLLAFANLGMCFALTTNMQQFIQSLEQQLRLPAKFAYGILAALNLAPLLPFEYKKNVRALQARGKHAIPLSSKLLTPLMIKTIRWSESLAIAMESKGFDENVNRSHYQTIAVKWYDYCFMFGMIVSLIIAIFVL